MVSFNEVEVTLTNTFVLKLECGLSVAVSEYSHTETVVNQAGEVHHVVVRKELQTDLDRFPVQYLGLGAFEILVPNGDALTASSIRDAPTVGH